MSLKLVLEDWSDYDDRKKRIQDAHFFACTEKWEADYLTARIRKVYPFLNALAIADAITQCCRSVKAPHARHPFVECVLKRLGVIA